MVAAHDWFSSIVAAQCQFNSVVAVCDWFSTLGTNESFPRMITDVGQRVRALERHRQRPFKGNHRFDPVQFVLMAVSGCIAHLETESEVMVSLMLSTTSFQ